ncbi:NAD-dependent epimerase/dehydratase family protein [Belnapia sp. T6]|uniref:NAD-dependent epimerase/dehydratase family protein n=1 Tax=Belnapia mucosa TaxID=2804532 RepID=A0ABS1VAV5_9PROT|nr:NAD-dependent epimerase/dehydratase family protein [Belnapia mucosa]MBL6458804.1 NAD-dependent epimerase/dehydratase family protein [Belnapia mucosa]
MKVLVTGSAGFIGFHVSQRLLAAGHQVAGVDAMVPYYDVTLKERRHGMLSSTNAFRAHVVDIADMAAIGRVMEEERPEVVIHLAAQAGVRYSLEHPETYIAANVVGTFNLLELCRRSPVRHFLMASTSSAYGANVEMPFRENDKADTPLTIYAATKKSTELIAHSYAHLWQQPITAFRFFTVYGPWGRPDMALFKFTRAALEGKPIDVYGHGRMERDFTYIDDLVEAIIRLVDAVPVTGQPAGEFDSLSPVAPYRMVNIGNGQPVGLMPFIEEIERSLGRPIQRNYMDIQPGDVPRTWADATLLEALTGFKPSTPVSVGVARFVAWFREYYGV